MVNGFRTCLSVAMILVCTLSYSQPGEARRDAQAVEVLKKMSVYKDSLASFEIRGNASSDARLGDGLIVANTEEIRVVVQRPGSMHFNSFNGTATRDLYIHEGTLSLFDSAAGDYAQMPTPKGLDQALDAALEEYNIDLPLMDLARTNTFVHLLEPEDSIVYLGSNSRVGGEDCHHLAIRMPELDAQLWISAGDQPLPRKIILTSKWEGGTPRFIAEMSWNIRPVIAASEFAFSAPDGADRIDFVDSPVQ